MVGITLDRSITNRLLAEKPPNVYYLGPVSDDRKNELIKKCSAGMTTSKYEGFGWVPFEFLTNGKPVLAYPLKVFNEIYGDLIIYAPTISDFIKHLKELYYNRFRTHVDKKAIRQLQATYDLNKAASKIIKRLNLKKLTIFTPDIPVNLNMVLGALLVDWKLWRSFKDNGISLRIFSNGEKFSQIFGLIDYTIYVGRTFQMLENRARLLEENVNVLQKTLRQILRFALLLVEPLCYVFWYIKNWKDESSKIIFATGDSQFLASIILKYIFKIKILLLMHDGRPFHYELISSRTHYIMKIYYLIQKHFLNHIDHLIVVSRAIRDEFLTLYRNHDKLEILWEERACMLK